MADYWKSTPKYWCKHCSTYVTDTKLGRANHEATGKHQGAVRRALRDLHRSHEREERDKERARQEIDRLNGIVSRPTGTRSQPASHASESKAPLQTGGARRDQLEQLAGLGVSIPDAFRGDIAMAGEWQVTTTRVVGDGNKTEKAVGVRKRALDDDNNEDNDQEHKRDMDAAVQGLFKKPRRWGRDSKTMAMVEGDGQEGVDLDRLLSEALAPKKVKEEVKEEREKEERLKEEEEEGKKETGEADVKEEDKEAEETRTNDTIKSEDDEKDLLSIPTEPAPEPVFFKKRKKNRK